MAANVARVKGMYDITPSAEPAWRFVFDAAASILDAYGYGRIRTPILEKLELFVSAIGDDTDVVGKEMYAFEDLGGARLALRPEGTAGCVRAMIDAGLVSPGQMHRVWYRGPMFRRENVQRGRSRQFYQIGAEAFGMPGPDVDAEMIAMLARLWRTIGLKQVRLELNTLGTPVSRREYREALVDYLSAHEKDLDEDSKRRLGTNPLRILDSKNPAMRPIVDGAPVGLDYLDQESREHFEQLQELLDSQSIAYSVNPRLVRGLDYYTKTVFEFITDALGSQGTICGGGRYDGLVGRQGGADTPAVGFSMGVERIVALLDESGANIPQSRPDAYFVLVGQDAVVKGHAAAERLRDQDSRLKIIVNAGGGSFKAQFKRADRSGARYAVVIGEREAAAGEAQVKPLRSSNKEQLTVAFSELVDVLTGRTDDSRV